MCEHNEFHASVTVNRITDKGTMDFCVEVSVRCLECGLPFEFIGLNCGLSYEFPTVDPTAQELRCPIRPKSQFILPGVLGDKFKVN